MFWHNSVAPAPALNFRFWSITDGLHDDRERRLFEVNRKSLGSVAMGGF
jgi:hypothetical protein